MTLIAICRLCAKERAASELKDSLCLDCQVHVACAEHRREYGRLWLKWKRYSRGTTASLANIEEQLRRVGLGRIRKVVGEFILDRERGEECWKHELRSAVEAVDPGARIVAA